MSLKVRLVVSHILVAVISGASTFVVVRWLAPALFDKTFATLEGPVAKVGGEVRHCATSSRRPSTNPC